MWRKLFSSLHDISQSRRSFLSAFALGGVAAPLPAKAASDPLGEGLTSPQRDQLWSALEQQGAGVLSSRAALQGGHVPEGLQQITLLGYRYPGDGGGGPYVRQSTDLGGGASVQSADGAWWRLRPEANTVSVRQFGAVGDGGTDDTQSLRDACAFAQNSKIARTVLFPPGRYRVTGPILSLGSGEARLAFRGEDAETTELLLGGDLDAPLISLRGERGADRVEWVTFSELTFRNPNRRHLGDCVHIHQAYHVDWIRCRFIGWNGHALRLDDYWDSNFDGCRIIGCGAPSESDAGKASQPYHAGKAAVWIGSSTERVTSNNLNFNACQFESSWHNQMRLHDKVRRVHLNSCKFHGNQRADISESQLFTGGAWACKVIGCAFAYGQVCDHIEFARSEGTLRNRGWSILGCDFSFAGGAAVRVRDGSHLVISGNVFGQIGVNAASIIVEPSVPTGPQFGQISIAHNSFGPRETPPAIGQPRAVITEIFGEIHQHISGRAQTVAFDPGETPHADSVVIAGTDPDSADGLTRLRSLVQTPDAGGLQFAVRSDGQLTPFLDLDGGANLIRSRQSLTIVGGHWDGPHLELGPCHIWLDGDNRLRMKIGAPESDRDGAIIGQ